MRSPAEGHERIVVAHTAPVRPGEVLLLQAELLRSERRLDQALADVVAVNADLRASNDDQHTLNEELRATNEELESSEEELRALNGELATRVDDLARAHSDLRSVIESTRIAIVFLDAALRIRSFTPAVQDVMHVRAADQGRLVTDLRLRIDYRSLAQDARRVLATAELVERHAAHPVSGAHYLVRLLPYRGPDDSVAGLVVTFLDITATVQVEQALRASDERFRRIAAAVPALLFIAGPDMAWDYVNPPFYSLTGLEEGAGLGTGWFEVLHRDDLDAFQHLWHQAGVAAATLEQEARLWRADGGWCWFLIRAVPQTGADGAVLRWYGSCTDIDDRRRVEAQQGLQLAEQQHRIKNVLAVVRSVLTRTLESSTDVEHFAAHLAGRIGALARTQSIAACTAEGHVMLEDLVYQELASHGGQDESQIEVDGPPVQLPGKIADSIGMTVHELATNSIKYGALAGPAGRVEVRWRLATSQSSAHRRLTLEWQETGVPVTDLHPQHRGFGRELIEQGLPYELGASTSMAFGPGGLRCLIELDLPEPVAASVQRAKSG